MKEVKLWTLEKDQNKNLVPVPVDTLDHTETEKQLEELLVRTPEILMPGLTLVGRQTPIEGGALDLLGVDEDGNLVVSELKRGTLSRDAVAQVIDYASFLASLDSESLSEHVSQRSGTRGIEKIEDFNSWYQERFPNNPEGYSDQPSMILVGLSADDRTRRMVEFLSKGGLDISLITFHAFNKGESLFLARQVEVQVREPPGKQKRYTKSTNLEALKTLASKVGSAKLLETMAQFFRNKLPAYEWPSRSGYSYNLIERTERGIPSYRVYVAIYVYESHPGEVQLVFNRRARQVAEEFFKKFLTEHRKRFRDNRGHLETYLKSESEWDSLSKSIEPLLQGIVDGWKERSQEENISGNPVSDSGGG
jgi:hypothetical protein